MKESHYSSSTFLYVVKSDLLDRSDLIDSKISHDKYGLGIITAVEHEAGIDYYQVKFNNKSTSTLLSEFDIYEVSSISIPYSDNKPDPFMQVITATTHCSTAIKNKRKALEKNKELEAKRRHTSSQFSCFDEFEKAFAEEIKANKVQQNEIHKPIETHAIGRYIPYHSGPDHTSFEVYKLKTYTDENFKNIFGKHLLNKWLRYLVNYISNHKLTNYEFVIAPSSQQGCISVGMEALVNALPQPIKRNVNLLSRTQSINPVHISNNRSIIQHLETIECTEKSVFGRRIVILDDITTTGNTLNACADVLFKAGAREVYALALGKTVKRSELSL